MADDAAGSAFLAADDTLAAASHAEAGWTRTTCPYCGVGCGVVAKPSADGLTAAIKGDRAHPANQGRLCSKGTALGETLALDDRLLHPEVAGRQTSWDAALDLVAGRFARAIAEHGPDSVAFYVSGQILTEDYYVANKLMKGFIGSANIDTNSRLCMASSVAGHKRAFGSDTVPGTYEDLELADLVVLVGSNLAWCHPVLYQRIARARSRRGLPKVVVIDPRRTATCDIADLHLAIAPGADVALFNGLLAHLAQSGRLDQAYIAAHTSGLAEALAAAEAMSFQEIVATTGLSAREIADYYEMFARIDRVVTVYSQGVNQSSAGTDKVNAIINCHLATGRIGRPGTGPFSVTGQPNAMGGRETGGLANMLAAHMEIADPEHRRIVQSFWQAPTVATKPGLKAVDLFDAVGEGRIKALWIMATNPAVSLPDADGVRAAIASCPFVVVSDVTRATDTTRLADVLLPSLAWGEKDGTVTNSERCISRQRAFLASPGEARADWWQMAEVAKRMGFGSAFGWQDQARILAEYAALTGAANDGRRDLDISAHAAITRDAYDALVPFQWPQPRGAPPAATRFFAEGGFFTPDRRARFVATAFRSPRATVTAEAPLVLNTGRLRDQWHTMTRTGKAARLMTHAPEPCLEIHPADAAQRGLTDGALATVETARGSLIMRVAVSDAQREGSVFAPIHWTAEQASRARVGALIAPHVDPISGQPETKHTPVDVSAFHAAWYAFAVTIARPLAGAFPYAAIACSERGWRLEAAGDATLDDADEVARAVLEASGRSAADLLAYHDRASGQHRYAAIDDGSLTGLLFISTAPVTIARGWAASQIGRTFAAADRLRLLAGRPGAEFREKGPIVCACMDIGRNQIVDAITAGCTTPDAVAEMTRAGTNCGSCRAEIGRLIHATRSQKAS